MRVACQRSIRYFAAPDAPPPASDQPAKAPMRIGSFRSGSGASRNRSGAIGDLPMRAPAEASAGYAPPARLYIPILRLLVQLAATTGTLGVTFKNRLVKR